MTSPPLSLLRAVWLPVLLAAMLGLWWMLEQSPARQGDAVVLRWVVNSQERDQLFAQAAKQAFEAKHPGIRIQFIKQNEGRKTETMIAGGDAPDIVEVGMDRVHYYVEAGVLRDLSGLMGAGDRVEMGAYFPVTAQPFRRGERVYALPWGYVPFILFYNKNLFDKYSLCYPSDTWTWEDYRRAAKRMTNDLDGDGVTDEFGASFAQWQEGYYCWIYQNGGRVLSADGRNATFDEPHVVEALEFLHRLTRVDRVIPTDVNKPKSTGMGLFEAGRLGMNGPTGSFYIPTYRTYEKVDWDIANVPAGPSGRGTMVAPIGFGVTTQSKRPREAFALVRFLTGPEGQRILAESGLFVPCRRDVALSDAFLKAPGPPANKYALVAMMDDRDGRKPWGITPPWSGSRWADVNDEALNARLASFLFGIPKAGETAQTVAARINEKANQILAEERAARRGVPMRWGPVWAVVGVAGVLGIGCWGWAIARGVRGSRRRRAEEAWGYLAISPWLIGFLVFTLGPIVFSIVLSFTRWNSLSPASQARFVGLDNYAALLGGEDELFLKSLRATLLFAAMSLPLGLVSSLLLALLMNAKLKGIMAFRTLYYLPAVMPAVATAVLFRWVFSREGILNYLLGGLGRVPFNQMPDWLNDPKWAVPAIVFMGLWGVGGGMMIYLAGLQNIPTQLYEAAEIDGAGALAKFRAVTLPMLSPTIFFNLVMGLIGAFQVFASAFVLFAGGTGPEDAALFYSYYLYRKAFEQFQVGYGSALAWILFVIILACTLVVFRTSSLWVYYEGQKEDGGRNEPSREAKAA
jgi:multiple sugar transport system permease protein